MSGANIIRRESEQAAKAIGTGTGPTDLNIAGLGGIQWIDGKPVYRPAAESQQVGGAYRGALAGIAEGLGGLSQLPAQFGQQAGEASQGLFAQLAGYDPLTAAENRYQRLQGVLGQKEAGQTGGLQASLLRQGRLGGTSGNALEGQLYAQQENQRYGLLDQLLGSEEQRQRGMLQDALQSGQAGTQAYGGLLASLPGVAQGLQQSQAAPFQQLLGMSQGIGNNLLQQQLARSSGINAYNTAIAGSSNASRGQFGQMAPGLLTGLISAGGAALGGPIGGAAAGALTSGIGGGGAPVSPFNYSLSGAQGYGGNNGMGLFRY